MMSTWQKYLITTVAACGFAANAMAQYIWLDDKGVKQFSDTPPPASVPKKRILKEPGGSSVSAAPAEASNEAGKADNAASAPKAPMTTAERNADFNKRRAEQAEKEKKDAEASKLAADKARNCQRARDYQRSLESNQRLVKTDQNGNQVLISDKERAQEMREAKQIIDSCN